MSSQFTTSPITLLTAEQWEFLKEKYAAINVQNTTLDPRTAYGALDRAFYTQFGSNLPKGTIEAVIRQVAQGEGPTWTVPYHSQQPAQPYGHYIPPTTYPRTNDNQYNNAGYGNPPSQMVNFVPTSQALGPSISQAPGPSISQAPGPNSALNPAEQSQNPKAGKLSPRVVFAPPPEASHLRAITSRRKNVYLPNTKSAKTLWTKREVHKELIEKATTAEDAEIKAAVDKEYTVATFEELSQTEKDNWDVIAKSIKTLEESFALIPYEKRKEMVRDEFSILHQDTTDAFDILPVTINFIPGYGATPPHADVVTSKRSGTKSFPAWMEKNHPDVYTKFLSGLVGYSAYLWSLNAESENAAPVVEKGGDQAKGGGDDDDDDDDDDEVEEDKANNKFLPPVLKVKSGIRIFQGLDVGGNVHYNRQIYRECMLDRFRRAGYTGRNVDWARVQREPEQMLMLAELPMVSNGSRPVAYGAANTLGKADLDVWITFFQQHQKKKISWKRGMVFKPRATVAAEENFGDEDEDEGSGSGSDSDSDSDSTEGEDEAKVTPGSPPTTTTTSANPPPPAVISTVAPIIKAPATATTTAATATNPDTDPTPTDPAPTDPAPTKPTVKRTRAQNKPSAASLALAVKLTTSSAQNKLTRRGGGYDYDRDDAQRDFFATSEGQEGLAHMYDRVAARNEEEEEEEEEGDTITIKQELDAGVPTRRVRPPASARPAPAIATTTTTDTTTPPSTDAASVPTRRVRPPATARPAPAIATTATANTNTTTTTTDTTTPPSTDAAGDNPTPATVTATNPTPSTTTTAADIPLVSAATTTDPTPVAAPDTPLANALNKGKKKQPTKQGNEPAPSHRETRARALKRKAEEETPEDGKVVAARGAPAKRRR